MKIILSGGGTLGPVVPLLAIAEAYREHDSTVEFIWIGTQKGPERALVEQHQIPFIPIGAGKWRRYFSIWNFFDFFKLIIAFFQSLAILWHEKPDLVISAGGYVSVPLHYAAAFLAMPSWVHQQDVQLGLANKLMFPLAWKITTALEQTVTQLPSEKTEWIGNPSRNLDVPDPANSRRRFSIPEKSQVIFALGGGTGSLSVNQLMLEALPQLDPSCHVIHLVGRERPKDLLEKAAGIFPNLHVYEFFTEEMKDAYAISDLVFARAGFSTLTELAALSKPAIILPMFNTHQEDNARYFARQEGIIMLEPKDNGLKLSSVMRDLLSNQQKRRELGNRLHQLLPSTSKKKIVEIVANLTKKHSI